MYVIWAFHNISLSYELIVQNCMKDISFSDLTNANMLCDFRINVSYCETLIFGLLLLQNGRYFCVRLLGRKCYRVSIA